MIDELTSNASKQRITKREREGEKEGERGREEMLCNSETIIIYVLSYKEARNTVILTT